ncbi:MAG: 5'-methylthioadenosine/adenosylhomocysteine nucleosidase [Bacilli bacterium]|nr:5'-methylthioadenosine/adenosylhomocysteine nucleosidase [Bacilli bacterium]
MIAVICAMQIEAEALIQKLDNITEKKVLNKTFYQGSLNGKEVVLVICGIGKVAAGITTALLIEHFKPELIINSGIAGGYDKGLNTLDLVVSKEVSYYDVNLTADGEEYGKLPNMPKYFESSIDAVESLKDIDYQYGLIVTADTFADNREVIDNIVSKYYQNKKVLAVDMESASVAQVCFENNVPFINFRVISDVIGAESQIDGYYNFAKSAADKSIEAILNIVK